MLTNTMPKPLGYFASGETQLVQLEEKYGSYLERLSREQKLIFRLVLTQYLTYKELVDDSYTLIKAAIDAFPKIDKSTNKALTILSRLSHDNCEGLIEMLTVQLRWGCSSGLANELSSGEPPD